MRKLILTALTLVATTYSARGEPAVPLAPLGEPVELTESQMDSVTAGSVGSPTLNIATAVSTNVVITPATAIAVSGLGNSNAAATSIGFASNAVGLGQSVLRGGGVPGRGP